MWLFKAVSITTIDDLPHPTSLFGFIYKITNKQTGQIYIGKKHFFTNRKKRLAKRALSADRRKKNYRHVSRESDWKEYWSSSSQLQKDVLELGEQEFHREILELSCSQKYLNYLELKYMILYDVLVVNSYNGNIAGRYYHKDMDSNCY